MEVQQLKDKQYLFNSLYTLIKEEMGNLDLLKSLNKFFLEKNLNIGLPTLIMTENKELESLSEKELIVFALGVTKYFKNNETNKAEKGYIINSNPYLYFYSMKVETINMQVRENEKIDPYIELDMVQKINDKEYATTVDFKQVVDWYNENKIQYIRSIQRSSKIEVLPNGIKVKKTNVNKKNVENLKERFLNFNKFLGTTEISITLLIDTTKEQIFDFKRMYKDIGVLKFLPCFDATSPNYQVVAINDGFSRLSAFMKALEINPNLNRKISLKIRRLTLEEGKQVTGDSFKQSQTSSILMDSYEQNPINNFISKMTEQIPYYNILADTKSKEEDKTFKGSVFAMREAVELLRIETTNETKIELLAIQTGKKIKAIIDYIKSEHFNDDILQMEKNSNLLLINSAVMYIYIGYKIRKADVMETVKIGDFLYSNQNKLNKIMNLNPRSVKVMFEHCDSIFKEVL